MSQEQTEPEQVEDSVAERSAEAAEPVEPEAVADEQAAEEAEEAAEETAAEEPEEAAEETTPTEPEERAAETETAPEGETEAAIEPATAEDSPEPAVIVAPELPLWPFVACGGVWLAYAGLLAWLLSLAPKDASTYSLAAYPVALSVGIALVAAGPVLAIWVWLSVRKSPWRRPGMFATSMFRGALVTLLGVVLWWAGLVIGDFLRLR